MRLSDGGLFILFGGWMGTLKLTCDGILSCRVYECKTWFIELSEQFLALQV